MSGDQVLAGESSGDCGDGCLALRSAGDGSTSGLSECVPLLRFPLFISTLCDACTQYALALCVFMVMMENVLEAEY